MMAGGGVWHRGGALSNTPRINGFQLWVALPPALEESPAESVYVQPEDVPEVDGVRVLLGSWLGHRSPVPGPSSMNYLDVWLERGQRWSYAPPEDHQVAWCFVHGGRAKVNGVALQDTLAVFEPGTGALEFEPIGPARILLGSAALHAHPLVLGTSSVHTELPALQRSLQRIRTIGADLRQRGAL